MNNKGETMSLLNKLDRLEARVLRQDSRNNSTKAESSTAKETSEIKNRIEDLRQDIKSNSSQNSQLLLDDPRTPGSTSFQAEPKDQSLKLIRNQMAESIDFTASQRGYYRKQSEQLDVDIKKWQGVKDDTGNAKAQVAQIKAQKASTQALQSFFSTEQDFWKDETAVKYQNKDTSTVQKIYDQIKQAELGYEQMVMAQDQPGILSANKELKGLKSQLTKLRGYETKQPAYKDPNALNENVYGQFKIDAYIEQNKGLKELQQKWIEQYKANPKDQEAKTKILEITQERKQITDAKKFWIKETEFWRKLGNAGFSTKNEDQIAELSFKLNDLDNQMDQLLSNDAKQNDKSQIRTLSKQISDIQSKITNLHTEI